MYLWIVIGSQLLIKLIVVYIFLVFWMPYPEENRLMRLGSLGSVSISKNLTRLLTRIAT
jgi:hypothetical protein